MVKYAFLFIVCSAALFANAALEKANSFANTKAASSKNLVSFLFQNEDKYIDKNGSIDSILILKTLRDNSLLELYFKEPQELEMTFTTQQNPLIFVRVITESLNSMGYNFFITKRAVKTPEEFTWTISLSTQNVPNPLLLNENFKAHGCAVLDIEKEGNNWIYKIDSRNAKIDTIPLNAKVRTNLKKPLTPYIFSITDSMETMTFWAHASDHWYPKISFYAQNLQLIKTVEQDRIAQSIKIKPPKGSAYMKVEDRYTLENIKRGLSVLVE
ncbi:MAG: hypothetical protein LBB59_01325 [Campylobacteraceae bacterium]|nr:hypothetical protein [Campylobacteraceae bacterium]